MKYVRGLDILPVVCMEALREWPPMVSMRPSSEEGASLPESLGVKSKAREEEKKGLACKALTDGRCVCGG